MNFTQEVYGSCCGNANHHLISLSDRITATFAKRLKEARALRGLSQRALGGLVDSDKNKGAARVNRYEQEVNRADMDKALELAKALNVPLAYLFAETDDLAEMILVYSQLGTRARAKVMAEIRELIEAKKA